jgi:hypothetical protein
MPVGSESAARRSWDQSTTSRASGRLSLSVKASANTRAIIGYRTGERDGATTDDFIQDLRGRVLGVPEISTDGLHYYKLAIRDAFGKRIAHGVVQNGGGCIAHPGKKKGGQRQ